MPDDADMAKASSSRKPVTLTRASTGKDDVTQVLITQFQQMLRDGKLSQGDRLPPERELAAHFNVARSSLRQALKVLEILGVITQRVGDGSYLNSDVAAILAVPLEFLFLLDDTTVEDLTELRLLMEPGLARLAAQRATPEDIAMLHQSILDLESSSNDKLKLVSSDLLFHRAIFLASKNRTAANLFHNIHRAMAKMMLVTSQLVDLEHTLAFHKPIMQAIEKGKGDLAARLMKEHLEDARELLIKERDHQPKPRLGNARRHVPSLRAPVNH
ncbi:transcriptional regulator [Terriglobus roseus DSM 18391]|uniref:Transcriptional regulator n=1 Tax=Terriglobus roseus (strain DSM 18391 / NRRL B-41598 / KBS 63) TaxID=926566 RepID=I3ZDV5_TERRK|nr:FadR/GntR family transcriptional regulator [Terriglobus roseus]AFL87423.1 transcriptional regulator [Terriglobus roseus DSM 18391]